MTVIDQHDTMHVGMNDPDDSDDDRQLYLYFFEGLKDYARGNERVLW